MDNNVVSAHIQDCFVVLSITDTKFLSMARKNVKPAYFSSIITEDLIRLCYSYYDQFQEAPNDHFNDEVVRFLNGRELEDKKRYTTYLTRVNSIKVSNKEYIMSRINDFIKAREFSESAIEFVKLTEKGKFIEAEQLMMHTLRIGIKTEDVGIKYLDSDVPIYYTSSKGEELMTLGVPALDTSISLKRGQVICILGGGKGKKSWFCTHLTRTAMIAGLKVLYISHELTDVQIEQRTDMIFGGLVSDKKIHEIKYTKTDDQGIKTAEGTVKVDNIWNSKAVEKTRKIVRKFGGQLIIKKYPMGTCSIGEMTRYLDYLEVFENYIPDVIINDYADIMKLPLNDSASNRDKLNACYIWHKTLADERNVLVITPSQTNREGLEKAFLSKKDFAEDIRKLANVDLVVALAQNKELAKEERMRIFILAAREGPDGFGCLVTQSIATGQFVVDSWFEPQDDDD